MFRPMLERPREQEFSFNNDRCESLVCRMLQKRNISKMSCLTTKNPGPFLQFSQSLFAPQVRFRRRVSIGSMTLLNNALHKGVCMKIEIYAKNVKNKKQVQGFIGHKVHTALDRLDSRIKQVSCRINDKSKNQSEFIGDCRIDVDLFPRRSVHVAAKGDSVFECIVNAIRKMEQAVKHELDRGRSSSNIRHQQNKRNFVDFVEKLTLRDELAATE